MHVLTVGDGDLSLSLALARAYLNKNGNDGNSTNSIALTATTLLPSVDALAQTYNNNNSNSNAAYIPSLLEELADHNVRVLYGVDATQLHRHPEIRTTHWDLILFHHPHLGTNANTIIANDSNDMDAKDTNDDQRTEHKHSEAQHARKHFQLLAHYFHSAAQVVVKAHNRSNDDAASGCIHVCLRESQAVTWDLERAAARSGLAADRDRVPATQPTDFLFASSKDTDDNTIITMTPPQPGMAAPRKFRNGRHASRHWWSRYGYRHVRTHGNQATATEALDTSGAYHYVFRIETTKNGFAESSADAQNNNETNSFVCPICEWSGPSAPALHHHLQAPALPEPTPAKICSADADVDTPDIATTTAATTLDNSKSSNIETTTTTTNLSPTQPHDTPLPSAEGVPVPEAHDGRRLRWFLQHRYSCQTTSSSDVIDANNNNNWSKRHCEQLCRQGRVRVNGIVTTDSSRILRTHWMVHVVAASEEEDGTSADNGTRESSPRRALSANQVQSSLGQVPSLQATWKEHGLVVVHKPVGMRTVGQFVGTLEHAVAQEHSGCRTVSNLETGIGGLCVVAVRATAHRGGAVQATYTAMVHGRVDPQWIKHAENDDQGTHTIPMDGVRRWKRHTPSTAETVKKTTTARISLLQQTTNATLTSTTSTNNDSDYTTDDAHLTELSTLQICMDATVPGAANALAYYLRQAGHPIVGDRFAQREYAVLPRAVRNRLKSKLCLGLTRVALDGGSQDHQACETPVPEKWLAKYWQDNFFQTK